MTTLMILNKLHFFCRTKFGRVLPFVGTLIICSTVPLVSYSKENYKLNEKNLNMLSGTESGGGGSTERKIFYNPLSDALEKLAVQPEYTFKPKFTRFNPITVKMTDLVWALRNATVIPTHDQLYDKDGVKVDALNKSFSNSTNDLDQGKIWVNIDKWKAKSDFDKVQLGLHELMGVLKLPDPYYWLSTRLTELILTNTNLSANSVTVCGITVKSMSFANSSASIENIKTGFSAEGAQVKTCLLKGFRGDGRDVTAVIGVYLNGSWALLVVDSPKRNKPDLLKSF